MYRSLVAVALTLGLVSTSFAADYKFTEKTLDAQNTVAVRAVVKDEAELQTKIQELVPKLVEYLQSGAVEMTGTAYFRYHRYEPGTAIDFEMGVPVAVATAGAGEVIGSSLPAGRVVVTEHSGAYEGIGDAYQALHTWIAENGKEENGGPWEVYVKTGEKPEENLTEIYYPIK